MLNILVPMVGKSNFFNNQEYQFPKPLVEINGKPMIQHVVENLNQIAIEKRFVFIVNSEDCQKFHIDNVLLLLTNGNCEVIQSSSETKGAACTCLLAIDYINNNQPLIISNADQIITADLGSIIAGFLNNNVDGGVLNFSSVHPRWSFARVDSNDIVLETAEKRPISKRAIAGLYLFKQGKTFVDAAMNSIRKDANVNGAYFLAPTLNELILKNLIVKSQMLPEGAYHSFYSPQKINEYEKQLSMKEVV